MGVCPSPSLCAGNSIKLLPAARDNLSLTNCHVTRITLVIVSALLYHHSSTKTIQKARLARWGSVRRNSIQLLLPAVREKSAELRQSNPSFVVLIIITVHIVLLIIIMFVDLIIIIIFAIFIIITILVALKITIVF